jgi:hypothetical protein
MTERPIVIQWFELLKRLAGAGAAASLLIASPGLGCYRAFAQTLAAPASAPLPAAPALPARLAAPGAAPLPALVPAPRLAAPGLNAADRLGLPLRGAVLAPLRRSAERGARVRGLLDAAPRLRTASAAAASGHARALFDALTGVRAPARPALLADADGPRTLRRDFENFGRLAGVAAEAA